MARNFIHQAFDEAKRSQAGINPVQNMDMVESLLGLAAKQKGTIGTIGKVGTVINQLRKGR